MLLNSFRTTAERNNWAAIDMEVDALGLTVECTEGYPYFLQEVGSSAWKFGLNLQIKLSDVQDAIADVEQRLDAGYFRVRVDRCTGLDLAYLRAIAELGLKA